MHTLHNTEGIILSASDFGEADRIFSIYTKDFGRISALAKGIRLEKSKLRTNLRPFSLARVSFVEGREFLRLTDAEEIHRPNMNGKKFFLFGRIASFLERMLKGTERDDVLWKTVLSAFLFMHNNKEIPEFFKPLFGIRVLKCLGYVEDLPDNVAQTANSCEWKLNIGDKSMKNIKQAFDRGIRASQL